MPELQCLELLAGEKGLEREIKDVTVLEVPDPEPWMKGGELILTAFYGLRGDNRAQVRLVKTVASIAAGICFSPGPGVPLEPEVLETADKLSLPILRMPGDMPYARVISSVLQAILNRQAYLLSRSSEISSMMIKGILNGAESKEIVAILARLLKNEEGGYGLYKGGKGVRIDYRIKSDNAWLTVAYTRSKVPPWPLAGGHSGSPNQATIVRSNGGTERYSVVSGLTLNTDDIIRVMTGTGAGWGDPLQRELNLIKEDLKNEYITLVQANRYYDYEQRLLAKQIGESANTAEAGKH